MYINSLKVGKWKIQYKDVLTKRIQQRIFQHVIYNSVEEDCWKFKQSGVWIGLAQEFTFNNQKCIFGNMQMGKTGKSGKMDVKGNSIRKISHYSKVVLYLQSLFLQSLNFARILKHIKVDVYIDIVEQQSEKFNLKFCSKNVYFKYSNTKMTYIIIIDLSKINIFNKKNGVAELRSRRLVNANHALYQMSYYPKLFLIIIDDLLIERENELKRENYKQKSTSQSNFTLRNGRRLLRQHELKKQLQIDFKMILNFQIFRIDFETK
ncbi:unnamed protein product [Paramecium octaurelia]|uniref:Uncharacterized protein n=1 Tax=Paramecium octaurelia TaxID=43137 RepID=A0A8S1VDP2_PAROT|nr:unnamed protein product [Paramecium octaurelia]